jgi:hypothetical protein
MGTIVALDCRARRADRSKCRAMSAQFLRARPSTRGHLRTGYGRWNTAFHSELNAGRGPSGRNFAVFGSGNALTIQPSKPRGHHVAHSIFDTGSALRDDMAIGFP